MFPLSAILTFCVTLSWVLGLRMVTDYRSMHTSKDGKFVAVPIDRSKKLLWFIRYWFESRHPVLGKPLILCVPCMCPLHSVLIMPLVWLSLGVDMSYFIANDWFALLLGHVIGMMAATFFAAYFWKNLKN